MSKIAREYGITATAIASANALSNPNAISIGQRLQIPAPGSTGRSSYAGTPSPSPAPPSAPEPQPKEQPRGDEVVAPEGYGFYQVEPKDTLHSIAISFGTNSAELRKLNELGKESTIRVGDFLLVPVPDDSYYES